MTLVFSRAPTQSPLHVLIVGVGWYGKRDDGGVPIENSPQLSELPGVIRSAERAVQFWLDADAGERLINCQIGSIDVLLSSRSEAVSLRGVTSEAIEPAIFENICKAVDRWARAGAAMEGSVGVLHWIGHGQNESGGRESHTRAITLFCEDLRDDGGGNRQPLAISLSQTLQDLKRIQSASRALVFIDACRSDVAHDDDFTYRSALPFSVRENAPIKNKVICYSLIHEGEQTLCRPDCDEDAGFNGGAMITEAILDALSSYGGEKMPGSAGRIVYSAGIENSVNARLEWWASHLKTQTLKVAPDCSSTRFPLIRVPQPRTMIWAEVRPRQPDQPGDEPILRRRLGPYCNHTEDDILKRMTKTHRYWLADVESGRWCALPTSAKAEAAHNLVDADIADFVATWSF